jgi:hypothetical protein
MQTANTVLDSTASLISRGPSNDPNFRAHVLRNILELKDILNQALLDFVVDRYKQYPEFYAFILELEDSAQKTLFAPNLMLIVDEDNVSNANWANADTLYLVKRCDQAGINIENRTNIKKLALFDIPMTDAVRTSVQNLTKKNVIEELYIPTWGTNTITNSAFENATGLVRIKGFNDVTSLGTSAFKGCTSLTEANLSLISTIGESAFENCIKLASFAAPNSSVTSQTFGAAALRGCYALKDLTLIDNLTVGYGAFAGLSLSLLTIRDTILNFQCAWAQIIRGWARSISTVKYSVNESRFKADVNFLMRLTNEDLPQINCVDARQLELPYGRWEDDLWQIWSETWTQEGHCRLSSVVNSIRLYGIYGYENRAIPQKWSNVYDWLLEYYTLEELCDAKLDTHYRYTAPAYSDPNDDAFTVFYKSTINEAYKVAGNTRRNKRLIIMETPIDVLDWSPSADQWEYYFEGDENLDTRNFLAHLEYIAILGVALNDDARYKISNGLFRYGPKRLRIQQWGDENMRCDAFSWFEDERGTEIFEGFDDVTRFESYAFTGNYRVKSIRGFNNVTDLGVDAIIDNLNLESVIGFNKIEILDFYCNFGCCSFLRVLSGFDSVEEIRHLHYLDNLETLSGFPSLKKVDNYTLEGCGNLANISIGYSNS